MAFGNPSNTECTGSRGHLLGRQLGGSGEVAGNLVALYQRRANSPVMRDYESAVAEASSMPVRVPGSRRRSFGRSES